MNTIDWPPPRQPRRRGPSAPLRRHRRSSSSAAGRRSPTTSNPSGSIRSDSPRCSGRRCGSRALIFTAFTARHLPAAVRRVPRAQAAHGCDLTSGPILINGQPLRLPVEPVLRLIALVASAFLGVVTGLGMMGGLDHLRAVLEPGPSATAAALDPIFGRPHDVLPVHASGVAAHRRLADLARRHRRRRRGVLRGHRGRARVCSRAARRAARSALRGLSIAAAAVLLAFAAADLRRPVRPHSPGPHDLRRHHLHRRARAACRACSMSRSRWCWARSSASSTRSRHRGFAGSCSPLVPAVGGVRARHAGRLVCQRLRRQAERAGARAAVHHEQHRIHAGGVRAEPHRPGSVPGRQPASTPSTPTNNRETLENIRLWDWRALQDTLRQIQEIRTYYDFPDIDIDRYTVNGKVRQMMLAVRELNVDRLPESSRNWINEKLIYTHGYGVTMNPVNGFTPEGLPDLLLGNMPVQSTFPGLTLTRPQIYFGELTNTDVYVRDEPEGVQLPAGRNQQLRDLRGDRRHRDGRRSSGALVIALDRGDLTKVPFSDDITSDSRLLMRRNIRERLSTVAPFLTFDADPYIVVTKDGRLVWMVDGFTTSASYPYARHYRLGERARQLHAQQRQGDHRRLRRHGHLLRVRRRRSGHRGLSRASFPSAVQGCRRDAAGPAEPRALSGADARDAGGGLRAVSHDVARRVLQPRRSVDGRHRSAAPTTRASRRRRRWNPTSC